MKFDEVKAFCLHWGFDLEDEDHNLLPHSLFRDMTQAALKAGCAPFYNFMRSRTNTFDGFTSLRGESWAELETAWANYDG